MKEFFTDISKRLLLFLLIFILIAALVIGCIYWLSNRRIYPEGGMWYCEELQISINFDHKGISKAVIDGKEIDCAACYFDASELITIDAIHNGIIQGDQIIFAGLFDSLNGDELILCDRDTNVKYSFIRMD